MTIRDIGRKYNYFNLQESAKESAPITSFPLPLVFLSSYWKEPCSLPPLIFAKNIMTVSSNYDGI
jgi:hypothetical protein